MEIPETNIVEMIQAEGANQMLKEHNTEINTRVTRLESVVESLSGAMSEVSSSIKNIEHSLAQTGKTDLKTLATIAGSVVTVALTFWAILITPITQQLTDLKADLVKIDSVVSSYNTLSSDLGKLYKTVDKNTDRISIIERNESSGVEKEKYIEHTLKELVERDNLRTRRALEGSK